jgi:hypothetical protein
VFAAVLGNEPLTDMNNFSFRHGVTLVHVRNFHVRSRLATKRNNLSFGICLKVIDKDQHPFFSGVCWTHDIYASLHQMHV